MAERLGKLVEMGIGSTLRTSISSFADGDTHLISMRDCTQDIIQIDPATIRRKLNLSALNRLDFIQNDDIIFCPRQPFRAILVKGQFNKAVLSSPLYRLRCTSPIIRPAYLVWYLNQRQTENYLTSRLEGTVMRTVTMRELDNLEIELPDIATQDKIIDLNALLHYEIALLTAIKKQRERMVQASLIRVIKNPTKEENCGRTSRI